MDRLLTVAEAAEYLRITPQALYEQRKQLREPGTLGVLAGRLLLFRQSEIDAWLDSRAAEYRAEVEYRRARLAELGS